MLAKRVIIKSVHIFIIIAFFAIINALYKQTIKPALIIDPQKEVVNINPNFIRLISLGQNRMISSFFWITTLLRSDLKHYNKNDYNNWMFLRLKLITILSPEFYEAYLYGGMYLSIIKDDDLGAKYIYDKGIKRFPNDHKLLFNSGFHHFSELSDNKSASILFERAIKNGAPQPFLPTLLARIKSGEGNLLDAINLLESTLKTTPEESPIHERIRSALYAIHAERDLDCLNRHKKDCNDIDYFGNKYLKKGEVYYSSAKWKKYRIKKGKRKASQ